MELEQDELQTALEGQDPKAFVKALVLAELKKTFIAISAVPVAAVEFI